MKRILSVVLIFSILLSFSALAAPEGSLPTGLCGIDSALVGCWPMDEGSGTTVSDVGAAPVNDGTLNGSPTWATGHDGLYGLSLNGTSQYVTVLDEYSLDLTTGMTLAAWVKPAKLGTQNIIKKTTSTTNPGFELSLSSGQKVFVRINGSATYRIDSTTSYPIDGNTWMHVTATYDGTNIRLYVNSVLEGTKPGVTITANATNLGIGAEPATTPANYLMGTIDDVRVYNRALTLTEIQALYNNHRPAAVNDSHTTNVNTPLNVAAPGVLSNDTDADADTMTAIKTSDPAHGALTLNINGSFSYTPTAGYSGPDSFTYRASDGKHSSNAATVSISVGQPNNPPEVTNPGTQNSSEGAVISLQIQASDLDSDPLTYAASGLPEGLNINTSTGEIAGTITYHAGEGSPYSATVTVNDDRGGSTPVNFTWTVAQTASGLCSGPASGMAACWPMEENGGSIVIDATVNGNDGNLTGTPSWVTGKTGAYALSLNGSTNALVPDDPSLDIAGQITLAAWVKPAQTTTQNLIKKAVNSATDGYELGLAAVGSAAGQKYFVRFNQTTSGDGYRVNSTVNYPADGSTWVHVAAIYDGATISLYVNGVLNNSLTPLTPLTILTNDLSLGIGSDSINANRYTGAMDDARVYNRALTLPEIEILAGIPPSTPTAPSSLTATVAPGSQIDLTWADNSNNETGFQLETAPGPACTTWASLGSGAANAPTFRHWNTSANTQYCYRVRAAGSGGNSDWSNTATATTPTSYSALSLGRDRAYVRMTTEDQSAVQLKQFSLETWFRREGAGVTNTTGTGGIPQAIPLIAKGAAEAEDTTADENFLLVIDDATDVIAADFEECDPLRLCRMRLDGRRFGP